MKIGTSNNAELVILASKDYDQAMKVAEKMQENSQEGIVIASAEEGEFIHMTAVWSNFQKQEMRDEFYIAKKEVA